LESSPTTLHESAAAGSTSQRPYWPEASQVTVPMAHWPSAPSAPQLEVSPTTHSQLSFGTPSQSASSPGSQPSAAAGTTSHSPHTPALQTCWPAAQFPSAPAAEQGRLSPVAHATSVQLVLQAPALSSEFASPSSQSS